MHTNTVRHLALSLMLASSVAAHAGQLATFTFEGTIGQVGVADLQIPGAYNSANQASAAAIMAPFASGQSFIAEFQVDLDTPYSPQDGAYSFPNAITSLQLRVPQAGLDTTRTGMTRQGVSLTSDGTYGDIFTFTVSTPFGSLVRAGEPTYISASIYGEQQTGLSSTNPDLHALATSLNPARFNFLEGYIYLTDYGCGRYRCGRLSLNIQHMAVSSVPEPAAWLAAMAGGLVAAGTRRRRH